MRISTTQIYTEANRNMMEGQSRLADIQSKLSSGKNFTTLAEDPVGANQVVNLKRELAQFEVFQTNIDATRRRLDLEETTLDAINTVVTRAQELVIQAKNGTLTDADRSSISYEIEELTEYAASLMNTRDAKGEFIFSGSKGTTQTYTKNGDGTYTYQGDDTRRQIQVGSTQYLESTDTGQFLFEAIPGAAEIQVLGEGLSAPLAGALVDYQINDPQAFEDFMRSSGDLELSVAEGSDGPPARRFFSLRDSSGTAVVDSTGAVEMREYDPAALPSELLQRITVPGATLNFALPAAINPAIIEVTGDGAANAGSIIAAQVEGFVDSYADNSGPFTLTASRDAGGVLSYSLEDSVGNVLTPISVLVAPPSPDTVGYDGWAISFDNSALANGSSSSIQLALVEAEAVSLRFTQPKSNMLSALNNVTDALRNLTSTDPAERAELNLRLGEGLTALAAVQERLSQSVAGIGARLNTIEQTEYSNLDFKLLTESTLSAVEDLDYASASTELAKRQLGLEAAYASFAKIQGLSLFNYIN